MLFFSPHYKVVKYTVLYLVIFFHIFKHFILQSILVLQIRVCNVDSPHIWQQVWFIAYNSMFFLFFLNSYGKKRMGKILQQKRLLKMWEALYRGECFKL